MIGKNERKDRGQSSGKEREIERKKRKKENQTNNRATRTPLSSVKEIGRFRIKNNLDVIDVGKKKKCRPIENATE